MCVLVVAGGHALPPLEPAEVPFHRVACLVSLRVVGLGFRRRAGLAGRPRCPVAPATRGRRRRPGPSPRSGRSGACRSKPQPRPGLGAVMALAARQAQTQGASPLIGQDVDLGAEAAPVAIEGGTRPFLGRARRARVHARPCCPAAPRTAPVRPAGKPSGAARRLDRTCGPSGDKPSSL